MIFKEIRLRALHDSPSAFSSTYANESRLTDTDWFQRAAQRNGEKSIVYLAMDAGIPCGIARGFLDQDDGTRTYLVSMWISPQHRRLGVGSLLVNAILDWARTKHSRTLHLMVTRNNDAAIKFYQHLGFALTGRTEPYPNDPSLIEYEMSMSIPEGDSV